MKILEVIDYKVHYFALMFYDGEIETRRAFCKSPKPPEPEATGPGSKQTGQYGFHYFTMNSTAAPPPSPPSPETGSEQGGVMSY